MKATKTYQKSTSKSGNNRVKSTRQPVTKAVSVQAKLKVNEPKDALEQEADQVAESVVHQPNIAQAPKFGSVGSNVLQTQKSDHQPRPLLGAKAMSELSHQTSSTTVQRSEFSSNKSVVSPWVQTTIQKTQGKGRAMDGDIKTFMEERIGADFSKVNIHTDASAIQMNQQLGAKAFATGNDIYFNQNQYQPNHHEGQKLIAHELAHTLQQTGTIQRQDRDTPAAPDTQTPEFNQSMLELSNQITDLKAKGDHQTYAFQLRVEAILKSRQGSIPVGSFDKAQLEADKIAVDEISTIELLGIGIVEAIPDAFPETWADFVYDSLIISGFDPDQLKEDLEAANESLSDVSLKIPDALFEHALPVAFKELKKLKTFELQHHHAKLQQEHVVKEYALAGFEYVRSTWLVHFINNWNGMVEDAKDRIRSGEQAVDVIEYKQFVKLHGSSLGNMANRFQRTWDAAMFEEAIGFEQSLNKSSLTIMISNGISSIASLYQQWQVVSKVFSNKKHITNNMLESLGIFGRLEKAFWWAIELGYFGEATDEFLNNIKQHGTKALGMVALLIGSLAAGHFCPPLGVALDVLLFVWTGIDFSATLYKLAKAIKKFKMIYSIEDMQVKTGDFAKVLIQDGLPALIELVTMFAAMGIGLTNVKSGVAKERGIITEKALMKELGKHKDNAMIKKAQQSQDFLDQVGKTQIALSAVAESKGNVAVAKKLYKEFKRMEEDVSKLISSFQKLDSKETLVMIQKADLTANELRVFKKGVSNILAKEAIPPNIAGDMARISKTVGLEKLLVFSGVNDVKLIWDSKRYWGRTEGAVYGSLLPANTLLRRLKAGLFKETEGLVVFQGNAAKLFHAHEIEGSYSLMKNLLGQQKAGFGDIEIIKAAKFDKTIIVTEAKLSPKHHSPVPKSLKNRYKDETAWAQARYDGRRVYLEPLASAAGNSTSVAMVYMVYEFWAD